MKYQNPDLQIDDRIDDLIGLMSINEKVAQLCCILPTMLLGKTSPDPNLMQKYMPHGLGRITQSGTFAWDSPSEITNLINGVQSWIRENTRLGIPVLFQIEATNGLLAVDSTIFPSPMNLANSWNPQMVHRVADVIRQQMLALGTRQALSPVLDLSQDARWGRVNETFGEDPYLCASMGSAFVRGLQTTDLTNGVAACGKHFIGYSRTQGGLNQAEVDISERDLIEYFAFPFEAAIKDNDLKTIMCTYSSINGVPASANRFILHDLLREKLGFKGNLLCDGGSIEMMHSYHHTASSMDEAAVMALEAGLEADTPVSEAFLSLPTLVKDGKVSEELIDAAVRSILRLKFELGLFEKPFVNGDHQISVINDKREENIKLAETVAKESIVLLKNDNSLLPIIDPNKTIGLIGPNMENVLASIPGFTIPASLEMYKGLTRPLLEADSQEVQTSSMGGISQAEEKLRNEKTKEKGEGFESFMDFYYEMAEKLQSLSPDSYFEKHYNSQTLKDAFIEQAPACTNFLYAKGCDLLNMNTSGFTEAKDVAQKSDIVFIAMGDKSSWVDGNAGECHDSTSITLPGVQPELIKEIHKAGKPIVLIIFGARPHAITWEAEHIDTIMDVWYPGEGGMSAIAQTVFGKNNPSGKLAMTVPRSVGQIPIYYNHRIGSGYLNPFSGQDLVRSVGVAGYCNEPTTPLFPFGHGLSFTHFEYSDIDIQPRRIPINGEVSVSCSVKNIGDYDGDEVVQLYTFDREANITRPVRKLSGFVRVHLQKGESIRVNFNIQASQLSTLDVDMNLVIEPGMIDVMVGSSSSDIRLNDQFEIIGRKSLVKNRSFFSKADFVNS